MANAAKQRRGLQGRCWRGCSLNQVGIDQTVPWAHACTTPRARGRGRSVEGCLGSRRGWLAKEGQLRPHTVQTMKQWSLLTREDEVHRS
jgi:hypothetical protein